MFLSRNTLSISTANDAAIAVQKGKCMIENKLSSEETDFAQHNVKFLDIEEDDQMIRVLFAKFTEFNESSEIQDVLADLNDKFSSKKFVAFKN